MKKILLAALIFAVLATTGFGAEVIKRFDSFIKVQEDGSMIVTEVITVVAEGNQIKHGIYRDFPTRYRDNNGLNYIVGFDVLEVLRDNRPDGYFFSSLQNGRRVYIGKKKEIIRPGTYTYQLTYRTTRQLAFLEKYDELYWNVTGNGWLFPIEQARCIIELPGDAVSKAIGRDGFTGVQGSVEKNYTSFFDNNKVFFVTTVPLKALEGLTISVKWPKGYVKGPTESEKFMWMVQDNTNYIIEILSLFVVFIYFLFVWAKHGKDPERGDIIPRFVPPKGMSPAVIRYIREMHYDDKVFASAIVDMAVKGVVSIEEKKGVYTIKKEKEDITNLSAEEKKIFEGINGKTLVLEQKNHSEVHKIIEELKKYLKTSYEKAYFATNFKYFLIGAVISLAFMVISGYLDENAKGTDAGFLFIFICVWLFGWSAAVFGALVPLWLNQAKDTFLGPGSKIGKIFPFLVTTLFCGMFMGGEIAGLFVLYISTSAVFLVYFGILVTINAVFYHLLKAPTMGGRKVLDEIEGFMMYLTAAEKYPMEYKGSLTVEIFEKYLPYAIALGVEKKWAKLFSAVLSKISKDGEYEPGWYTPYSMRGFHGSSFASSFGSSLAGSISSSSTAPGGGSGGGGGGSGGGGGGGGGW